MKKKTLKNKYLYALMILCAHNFTYPAARSMTVSGFGAVPRVSTPFNVVAPRVTPATAVPAYPIVKNESDAPIEVKFGEIMIYAVPPATTPSMHDHRVSIMVPAQSEMMIPQKKFYINEEVFNSNLCIDSEGNAIKCE